jgi:hypothetical protein
MPRWILRLMAGVLVVCLTADPSLAALAPCCAPLSSLSASALFNQEALSGRSRETPHPGLNGLGSAKQAAQIYLGARFVLIGAFIMWGTVSLISQSPVPGMPAGSILFPHDLSYEGKALYEAVKESLMHMITLFAGGAGALMFVGGLIYLLVDRVQDQIDRTFNFLNAPPRSKWTRQQTFRWVAMVGGMLVLWNVVVSGRVLVGPVRGIGPSAFGWVPLCIPLGILATILYPRPVLMESHLAGLSSRHRSYLNRAKDQWKWLHVHFLPSFYQSALLTGRKHIHVLIIGASTGEELARTYHEIVIFLEGRGGEDR